MVERVLFYLTVSTGQQLVCVIESVDGQVMVHGQRAYAESLLNKVDGGAILSEVLRDAPRRYDGFYLRAEYQVTDSKNFVTLEDGRVIFIEGPGGGQGVLPSFEGEVPGSGQGVLPGFEGKIPLEDEAPTEPSADISWVEGGIGQWESFELYEEIRDSWEGEDRVWCANSAVTDAKFGADLLTLRENGELKAIASVDINYDDKFAHLDFLATKEPGYGRKMMELIMQHVDRRDKGCHWVSLPEARGFYEHLEFMEDFTGEFSFIMYSSEVKDWLRKMAKSLVDMEPENGVFAVMFKETKGFVTLEDGRVIFIEGPGGGGGTSSEFAEAATSPAMSGRISYTRELGQGGVCDAILIQYKDDGKGVWKMDEATYAQDANAEVAAYRINRLLGGNEVPETVFGEDEDGTPGSSQLFVEDAVLAMEDYHAKELGLERLSLTVPKEQFDQVIALDIITNNEDRHLGNFMFKEGRLIAIDHGYSFWSLADYGFGFDPERMGDPVPNQIRDSVRMPRRDSVAYWASEIFGHENIEGRKTYIISPELISRWSEITYEQFLGVLEGISFDRNVHPEKGWTNLQRLIEMNGRVRL
jgi:hypothetical protein